MNRLIKLVIALFLSLSLIASNATAFAEDELCNDRISLYLQTLLGIESPADIQPVYDTVLQNIGYQYQAIVYAPLRLKEVVCDTQVSCWLSKDQTLCKILISYENMELAEQDILSLTANEQTPAGKISSILENVYPHLSSYNELIDLRTNERFFFQDALDTENQKNENYYLEYIVNGNHLFGIDRTFCILLQFHSSSGLLWSITVIEC